MQLPNVPGAVASGSEEVARRLYQQGTVVLTGDLDAGAGDATVVRLLALDRDRDGKPITLQVSGLTGSVGAALALHDVLASLATPVHVVAGGLLDTAGALVLAAGTRGHRRLLPTARVHLRRPAEPSVPGLPLESAAEEVAHLRERAAALLGTELHPPRMLSAEEAVALGIADAVG